MHSIKIVITRKGPSCIILNESTRDDLNRKSNTSKIIRIERSYKKYGKCNYTYH